MGGGRQMVVGSGGGEELSRGGRGYEEGRKKGN